jgi:hypothetical protein
VSTGETLARDHLDALRSDVSPPRAAGSARRRLRAPNLEQGHHGQTDAGIQQPVVFGALTFCPPIASSTNRGQRPITIATMNRMTE